MYKDNSFKRTSGIAAQLAILEFTLIHRGAFRGHTGNIWRITPTLEFTVLLIKLLSRLRQPQMETVLAGGGLNERWSISNDKYNKFSMVNAEQAAFCCIIANVYLRKLHVTVLQNKQKYC